MRLAGSMVLLLAALAALVGCEELLRPGFPHEAHLIAKSCGEAGQPECPSCASCHGGIAVSESRSTPTRDDCERCHKQDTQRLMDTVRSYSARRTPIIFNHKQHLEMPAIAGQCVSCHSGVTEDGRKGEVFPDMASCTTCHDSELEQGNCTPCHQRSDMRKLVPETFLRHDVSFMRNHGLEAARQQNVCSQCHAENDCAACHDQNQRLSLADRLPHALEREFIHRGDFMVRHPIDARSQPAQCLTCHTQSYCDSCHVARGVSGNRLDAINPHPIGWIGPDPTSPNYHGAEARRDIVSCAACHDQGPATNCIRCHRVGAEGGNPHPSGWRSMRSTNEGMCRYCHAP